MLSELRKRLSKVLRTDEDLNAFCIDHFHTVHERFTSGMDRLGKVNLLLQLAEPEELERLLDQYAQGPLSEAERAALEKSTTNNGSQQGVSSFDNQLIKDISTTASSAVLPRHGLAEDSDPAALSTDVRTGAPNEDKKPRRSLLFVWASAPGIVAFIAAFALLSPPQVNGWIKEEPNDFLQAEVLQHGQEVWALLPGSLLHSTDGARIFSKEGERACAACGFWLVRNENQPRLMCCDGGSIVIYDAGFEDNIVLLAGAIRNLALSPDGVTAWAVREGVSNRGSTPIEILKTTDSGKNWAAIASHPEWKLWDHLISARRDGRRLFGYPPILPKEMAPGNAILVSDNDGKDWHPVFQAQGLAINRIASSSFSVCAVGRQIYRSKDGGDTWQQVPGFPPVTLWDVQSVNDGDYWAVGDDGALFRSTDCQAWTPIPTGTHASFRKVRVTEGGNKIFLFGANKMLRVSTDGGKTWLDPLLKGLPSWYYPAVALCLALALCGFYIAVRRRTPRLITTVSDGLATIR